MLHMPVLDRFYSAFVARDATTMGACYADDARFNDPAFPDLNAAEVRAMWKMLIGRSNDLRVKFNVVHEDERSGVCEWRAYYTFSRTGRQVHNIVRSEFVLRDGFIVQQQDRFDFWRWSRQALGVPGYLLGWSPLLKRRVQATAGEALQRAMR